MKLTTCLAFALCGALASGSRSDERSEKSDGSSLLELSVTKGLELSGEFQHETRESSTTNIHFESIGIPPFAARTQMVVGKGKTFTAYVDYQKGLLVLDGRDATLEQPEWEAINKLYQELTSSKEGAVIEEGNVGAHFLYRLAGLLAQSPRGYKFASNDEFTVPRVNDEGQWLGIGPAVGPGGGGTTVDPEPPYTCRDGPTCSSPGLTDSNPGIISCVEQTFYYCVEFDHYPNGILSPQSDELISAPVFPPFWSDADRLATPVWGGLDGGYGCNGKCGPGCDDPPWIVGGGGGWGLGCLIHDQCVWESTGGSSNPGSSNWPTDFDCGAELRAATNDHYMPPGFCPGTGTVGGIGFWQGAWGELPTFQIVSPVRLADSGSIPLTRTECRTFLCVDVPSTTQCEAQYGDIIDKCEGCTVDFFMNAIRGGLAVPNTLDSCGQDQCPGMLPSDVSGYEACVRQHFESKIRPCMLGNLVICSATDCSVGHCATEFQAFQVAGSNTAEESLWRSCRAQCQAFGFCGAALPQCSFDDCLVSVCADEGMAPNIQCYSSENGGVGNILVSYIHRQCVLNSSC